MDNEKRMMIWCRMWNEDPSLAHEVMTDDCVQWSDHSAGLDAVVGPHRQETFVAGYRARHVNIFSPRILVDADDRFAYLWDVRKPDGQVLTGIDVNILKGDNIQENWTFVAERRCEQPDPRPEPTGQADSATIEDLSQRWARLRNGRAELAAEIATGDFALFDGVNSAGDVHGPAELAELIERQAHTDRLPVFTIHRRPVVDSVRGSVALLWTADSRVDGGRVGGVDLMTVRNGKLARAWSLTGTRAFRY
jgi:hypothetical protein